MRCGECSGNPCNVGALVGMLGNSSALGALAGVLR
jgi:hypothetical protein